MILLSPEASAAPRMGASSENLRSVQIEIGRQPADDRLFPPTTQHFLTLHLGTPICLARIQDGREQKASIGGGSINIIPAGQSGRWRWTDVCESAHLYLRPDFLGWAANQAELPSGSIELLDRFDMHDPLIEGITRSLLSEAQAPGLMGTLYVESLTTALAVHLLRHHSVLGPPALVSSNRRGSETLGRAGLRRVVDYIEDHLNGDLTLSNLAAQAYLSPYHFTRLFKNSTGLPPHQYVIRARVERAKRLLSDPKVSVGEVALRVGFASQSHLHRHFKRLVGVSPGKFSSTS